MSNCNDITHSDVYNITCKAIIVVQHAINKHDNNYIQGDPL